MKCLCGLDNEERDTHIRTTREKSNNKRRTTTYTTHDAGFFISLIYFHKSQPALLSLPPFFDTLAVKNFIGRTSFFLLPFCLFIIGIVINKQLIRNYITLCRAHFLFSLRKKRDFSWCVYVYRCALYVHQGQKTHTERE